MRGTDLYAVFHGVRIAKRGANGTPQARTWISLEPGYRVRDEYGERGALTIVVEYCFTACSKLLGAGTVARERGCRPRPRAARWRMLRPAREAAGGAVLEHEVDSSAPRGGGAARGLINEKTRPVRSPAGCFSAATLFRHRRSDVNSRA